jgi:hypothetical protein
MKYVTFLIILAVVNFFFSTAHAYSCGPIRVIIGSLTDVDKDVVSLKYRNLFNVSKSSDGEKFWNSYKDQIISDIMRKSKINTQLRAKIKSIMESRGFDVIEVLHKSMTDTDKLPIGRSLWVDVADFSITSGEFSIHEEGREATLSPFLSTAKVQNLVQEYENSGDDFKEVLQNGTKNIFKSNEELDKESFYANMKVQMKKKRNINNVHDLEQVYSGTSKILNEQTQLLRNDSQTQLNKALSNIKERIYMFVHADYTLPALLSSAKDVFAQDLFEITMLKSLNTIPKCI